MDADLQDPPEMVPKFIECWLNGFSVVYAVRRKRKEGILKRACYATFYRTMKAIAEIDVPLDSGDFCLLDRRVVDVLVSMPERGRFLRGLRSWVGFRQKGVEYERAARSAGTTKYSLPKLVHLAFSGYVGFSSMPLRLASGLGVLSAGAGFAVAAWAVFSKIRGVPTPWGWASTTALTLVVSGVQLLVLGIIGEYLGRMFDEVRHRPAYVVSSRVGFEEQDSLGSAA
jgi:dolichol-phosphate mannosyltransferase